MLNRKFYIPKMSIKQDEERYKLRMKEKAA